MACLKDVSSHKTRYNNICSGHAILFSVSSLPYSQHGVVFTTSLLEGARATLRRRISPLPVDRGSAPLCVQLNKVPCETQVPYYDTGSRWAMRVSKWKILTYNYNINEAHNYANENKSTNICFNHILCRKKIRLDRV